MKAVAWAVLLVSLAAGCDDPEVTQVIVTVDADPEVRAIARELRVEVFGAARAAGSVPRDGGDSFPLYFVGDDAVDWPVEIALAPKDDDPNRRYRIVVTALRGTQFIGQVQAISGYVRGKTLWLRLYIDRFCLYVEDCTAVEDQTCAGGRCIDALRPAEELPEYGTDAGTVDVCETDAECDDGVGCTVDRCVDARCTATADDAACVDGPDGTCDPVNGCQYSICDETTCQPGPCEVATCTADARCMRTSTCTGTDMCCAGACVPDGCDDGNPCTADTCAGTGCTHAARDMAACENGVYCDGSEVCMGTSCDPGVARCTGPDLMCDEAGARCVGCTTDAHCPPDSSMGTCTRNDPTNPCSTAGTQINTTTYFRCTDGACEIDRTESAPSSCTVAPGSCSDGMFCNGTETCSGEMCLSGPSPCAGDCLESSDTCVMPDGGTDGGVGCTIVETSCADGLDEDCDAFLDCDDPDCTGDPACPPPDGGTDGCVPVAEDCTNGDDDDCDLAADCDDDDCARDPSCSADAGGCPTGFAEVCDNCVDDNCDGDVDCADAMCDTMPVCLGPVPMCADAGTGT